MLDPKPIGAGDKQLLRVLQELQSAKTEVLAGASANTAIAVVGIDIDDTIVSALLFSTGVPSDIKSSISITNTRASGTLTLSGVVAADAVAVNGKTYTAIADTGVLNPVPPYKFEVGASDTATAASLAAAINAADGATVRASSSGAVVTVRAVAQGVGGNSIALSAAASNGHVTASGANLAGGTATTSIKSTTDTSSKQIVLTWLKKPAQ